MSIAWTAELCDRLLTPRITDVHLTDIYVNILKIDIPFSTGITNFRSYESALPETCQAEREDRSQHLRPGE